MQHLSDNLTLPISGLASYITPTPVSHPERQDTGFIILQHSKSTGSILPYSNFVGVFRSREDAKRCTRELKHIQRPVVRSRTEAENGEKQGEVWCTSDGTEDEEMGFRLSVRVVRSLWFGLRSLSSLRAVPKIERRVMIEMVLVEEWRAILCKAVARMSCPSFLKTLDTGHFLHGREASLNMRNPDSSWRGPAAPVAVLPTRTNQQIQDGESSGGVESEDAKGAGLHDGDGVRTAIWY